MAIAGPHYRCLKELHRRGELHQGGSILEIGEANWYGDQPLDVVIAYAKRLFDDPDTFKKRLQAAQVANDSFAIVKIIYEMFFDTEFVVSIDMCGTDAAEKQDLNKPIFLTDIDAAEVQKRGARFGSRLWFNTVINHGTAEHIFDVCQVFKTMHDHCAVDGLMIHESPFTGWVDHGFYCIQPTAYFDVCAANEYRMVYMAVNSIKGDISIPVDSREHLLEMASADMLPKNSMLYVAMAKKKTGEFQIPMQHVYDRKVSEKVRDAWQSQR